MSLFQRFSPLPSSLPLRKLKDGTRFGPRLALDGGRIIQSSSRDVQNVIKRKRLTPEQTEEFYKRGILTKWVATPKKIRGKTWVEVDKASGWKRGESRRTGVFGKKIGMRREVDLWGTVHPVTLVQLQKNEVLQIKGPKDHQSEVYSLQIGAGMKKWSNLTKAEIGHLVKAGTDPKEIIGEFRVTPDALVPVGTEIPVTHFVVGQYLDVTGISKGKGTQGVMKRWGFAGGRASHGSSLQHRKPGSIAAGNSDPGKVWKGKKMPGRMGGDRITVQNLQLLKINTEDNILYIRGCIPGNKEAWVEVYDAKKRPPRLPPPFPTHLPSIQPNRPKKTKKYLRIKFPDPFKKIRTIDWETRWADARIALRSAQQQGLLGDDGEGEEGDEGDEIGAK